MDTAEKLLKFEMDADEVLVVFKHTLRHLKVTHFDPVEIAYFLFHNDFDVDILYIKFILQRFVKNPDDIEEKLMEILESIGRLPCPHGYGSKVCYIQPNCFVKCLTKQDDIFVCHHLDVRDIGVCEIPDLLRALNTAFQVFHTHKHELITRLVRLIVDFRDLEQDKIMKELEFNLSFYFFPKFLEELQFCFNCLYKSETKQNEKIPAMI